VKIYSDFLRHQSVLPAEGLLFRDKMSGA